MKITLMEAVMANLAAEEVGRQAVPYSLALALMKVKQATAAEAETFAAEERKLVEKFAAKDEDLLMPCLYAYCPGCRVLNEQVTSEHPETLCTPALEINGTLRFWGVPASDDALRQALSSL